MPAAIAAPALSVGELLQRLIRFDTTNPPGREAECIAWARELLEEAGIPTVTVARSPDRPNLVARLPGQGAAPPLLLYGHVDVVTVADQAWTHPPFEGRQVDGWIWGRGALDMKGGVAMMLSALLRARAEGLSPHGDVVLALLADEEADGSHGVRFLVDEHAALFQGVRHALGEFGGFSIDVGGVRFYPVMVAEKRVCCVSASVTGPGGHGSLPVRGGAMARLGELLRALDRGRLPVHVTPVVRAFVEGIAAQLPFPRGAVLRRLLNPALTDVVLRALGEQGAAFDAMLRNTVSPTVVQGGHKFNVIPSRVDLHLDGRLLPGCTPDDLLDELRALGGPGVEWAVTRHDPGPAEPDLSLFGTLAGVLREADPGGHPVPLLLTGATDARFFTQLGIQTYGFLPMKLPPGFQFWRAIHAADERVPVAALEFGADAIYQVLRRYGTVLA